MRAAEHRKTTLKASPCILQHLESVPLHCVSICSRCAQFVVKECANERVRRPKSNVIFSPPWMPICARYSTFFSIVGPALFIVTNSHLLCNYSLFNKYKYYSISINIKKRNHGSNERLGGRS